MTRREAVVLALGSWVMSGVASSIAFARGATVAEQGAQEGLHTLSIRDLVERIRRREVAPIEVVDAYLRRIDQLNPDLNAYVLVTSGQARARARQLSAELAAGGRDGIALPLAGLPITHKDLFDTAGIRTTGGSRLYADRVPRRDAELVARLTAAGAIMLGKTNTHELGGGVTTINPFYGTTRNPRDRARVAGGSSGGSAVAVAAHLAAAATGSDTGGSIRIPAAFCGCVGFKPTFGVLATAGLLGASPTFDHAGFLARSVEDVSLLLTATADGKLQEGSSTPAVVLTTRPVARLRGLRVGVPRGYFLERLDDDVARAFTAALARCREAGASVRDVSVPVDGATMARVFDPIVVSEIRATYDEAWRETPEAFSKDFAAVFSEPLPDPVALAAARRALQQFQADMARVFDKVDILAMPTVSTTAPRIDGSIDGMRILRNTWPFNAARLPALSIPCGPADQLPVGLQIVGRAFDDGRVLRVGSAIEAILV
jgi:aspartyl-tRNA(Asn)/glutamyl-tRNA(Gln) amidotransferase subunit A